MRVRLLGGFDVDGLAAHEVGSRKARTLLKALATARGQPVSIDRLTDILWPEALPARPAEQVQVLVSRLRATLGANRIVRTDAGYALRYDWLDLDELDGRADEAARRLAAGRAGAARAAATAALHLARGPLLAEEEGEWADDARRTAERTVARARLIVAEAALGAGDGADAARLAEAALDHDPYDERALRALMSGHTLAGRPASALAAYARSRERLAEELGVDPTPETEALHTAILRGEHSPAPAAPPTGHEDTSAHQRGPLLVGREAELEALDHELASAAGGRSRIVIVEGEAGMGKSTLVAAWTARLAGAAVVLTARCDELGRELPLQPILDALTDQLERWGPIEAAAILGADAPVLRPLLGPMFGDDSAEPARTADRPVATVADVAAGQARLFAALADVVQRVGAGGPAVVVVVEDLHLAGPSTANWLTYAVRRLRHLLVVATRCPGPRDESLPGPAGGSTIALGPLDVDTAAELVGRERAAALHARSGGNPLFLVELARSPGDGLPATIVEAVRTRASALGDAGGTIRTAALLGPDVDVDLLVACTEHRLGDVLDDLEVAVRCRLLVEQGTGFVFAHELVREAIAADVTAVRRAVIHRAAARALRHRADGHPLHTAFHARLGGAEEQAAASLVDAANLAADRFDADVAEQLLDQAIALADGPRARFARARVRMARSDHAGAAIDVSHAIGPDAGAEVFELAGWIAYYRRDFVLASRYADDAVRRAGVPAVRASALALAGRIRHSRGELRDAATHLEEAVAIAPQSGRGIADVWLASLRAHEGRLEAALAASAGVQEDEPLSHPFALSHALFARCLAHGLAGRLAAASAALAALERAGERLGPQGQRFTPVGLNMAAWLLRSTGRERTADERNTAAVELSNGTPFEEPRAHARLDLAEGRRRDGDLGAAAAIVEDVAATMRPDGTMAWHVRQRVLWLRGRIALEGGEAAQALELAAALVADAEGRGSARYAVLGRHLAALADPPARRPDQVAALLPMLDEHAGIDAWWLAAEVVTAAGGDGLAAGRPRAARLLDSVGEDVDRDDMARWLDHGLARAARRWGRISRSSK